MDFVQVWDPLEFLGASPEDIEQDTDIPFTRCIRSTAESICDMQAPSAPRANYRVEGHEVGDDRVDFSKSPLPLAIGLVAQETIVLMETSREDTFISPHVFNFTETSTWVPRAKEESFHYARKSGKFHNLGFADVPPLRIIIDAKKGDRSHSSTMPGKMSMLGARMRTPRTEFLQDWRLASYLQDGLLRTCRSTEPKYLPQVMGGSGVRAPYDDPLNLYLYVHGYRGGKYQRVYGSATRELSDCLDYLERGQASMPILCRRLRDKQEYLHGTYAEKILVPPTRLMDESKETLPRPLITASGGANRFVAYENRLIRTRKILPRSVAEREWLYCQRVRRQLLSGSTLNETDSLIKLERARARAKFGGALNANAAFVNLLKRQATPGDVKELIEQGFLAVSSGVTHFSLWDAQWLVSGGRKETVSIEDLDIREDLFLRTDVSEEETYKVGGIPLDVMYSHGIRRYITTTSVGLYQINQSMNDWATNLVDRLVNRRGGGNALTPDEAIQEYIKDPEWVNDDSTIIGRALIEHAGANFRTTRVVLISDDRRLANQLANTANLQVIRLPTRTYILWADWESIPNPKDPSIEDVLDFVPQSGRRDPVRAVYTDTGSLAATQAKLEAVSTDRPGEYYTRTIRQIGYDTCGKRFARYTLTPSKHLPYMRVEIHNPVLIPRRQRYTSAGYGQPTRSQSAISWRSGMSGHDPSTGRSSDHG
jgi:hypothetical protein